MHFLGAEGLIARRNARQDGLLLLVPLLVRFTGGKSLESQMAVIKPYSKTTTARGISREQTRCSCCCGLLYGRTGLMTQLVRAQLAT